MIRRRTTRAGIMVLVALSIPELTPPATIVTVAAMKRQEKRAFLCPWERSDSTWFNPVTPAA